MNQSTARKLTPALSRPQASCPAVMFDNLENGETLTMQQLVRYSSLRASSTAHTQGAVILLLHGMANSSNGVWANFPILTI